MEVAQQHEAEMKQPEVNKPVQEADQAQQAAWTVKFLRDVEVGLTQETKSLSSLYFYDDAGSDIYAAITECEDYYLTHTEFELLSLAKNQKAVSDLARRQDQGHGFNVLELGAGDGRKTTLLLRHFLNEKLNFSYNPIDISSGALKSLDGKMRERFTLATPGAPAPVAEDGKPVLFMQGVHGDNLQALDRTISEDAQRLAAAKVEGARKNMVLFMGSSIGNMTSAQSVDFLKSIWGSLNHGDMFCCGFDLAKEPDRMIRAYSDRDGLTAEFNYNLLRRMNSELGADFEVRNFKHHATYLPATKEMQSWLVSQKDQDVHIKGKTYHFDKWECMQTESSHKYTQRMVESFAQQAGFEVVQHLFDSKGWYCFSLWTVKKE